MYWTRVRIGGNPLMVILFERSKGDSGSSVALSSAWDVLGASDTYCDRFSASGAACVAAFVDVR